MLLECGRCGRLAMVDRSGIQCGCLLRDEQRSSEQRRVRRAMRRGRR